MEIKGGIDPDALLDYVELQILPNQNRYEAFICNSNKTQKVAFGTLEQLLLHSPQVKDLSSKGSNTNFKILPPNNTNDEEWFTTATFTRFLHIISSPDIFSIGNEINQLEETKKFQLSLSMKAEVDVTSSIDSKNDLQRAVDLRLTALKDKLVAAFDQAIGAKCSINDISDLEGFAHHLGAKDIRDSLQKFVEMGLFPSPQDFRNHNLETTNRKLDPSIKYDENSSFSSEEEKLCVERSHARADAPTPRRSASPMKRIQIGRSGSHRAAALTIKSLNYFPPREKLGFQKDEGSNASDEENPEKPANSNVLRMSVKDKISLFESKQRNQNVDLPKTKKKGGMRRWSLGISQNSTQNNNNTETTPVSTENVAQEPEISSESKENIKVETLESEREEISEWNQQEREERSELNELFIKKMESENRGEITLNKPRKSQKKSTPVTNPSVLNKAKASPLPATRKSWPESESRLTTLKTATPPGGSRKEKKQPVVTKNTKTNIPFSVSEKSSVVPLETKPFLRKGSGMKTKVSHFNNSNQDLESESHVVPAVAPELVIPAMVPESPVAEQIVSEISSPCVRRSLSEILPEEGSEGDSGGWGNAENPPRLVYQKDPPNGFKRLLKFGRKNQKNLKATRSIFSLSTFRGTKTNEQKLQGA